MPKFGYYRDALNTAAVMACNSGLDQETFVAAAATAYTNLVNQGYPTREIPKPPADTRVPLDFTARLIRGGRRP